jgi:hypothetical protein
MSASARSTKKSEYQYDRARCVGMRSGNDGFSRLRSSQIPEFAGQAYFG